MLFVKYISDNILSCLYNELNYYCSVTCMIFKVYNIYNSVGLAYILY